MDVLLGTDGSRYALAAAGFVGRWLVSDGMHVELVAVSPKTQPERGGYSPAKSAEQEWSAQARRWLERTASLLEGEGVDFESSRRVDASASDVFVEFVRDGRYDLAVLGVKGRGEEPHFRVGSVAAAALTETPIDLLLVRQREPQRGQRKLGSEMEPFRVLFPTDGRSHSELAMRRFLARVEIPSVEVRVISVPELPEDASELGRAARREAEREARERAEERVAGAVGWFERHGLPVEGAVVDGPPDAAVVGRARDWDAHMILLGSSGFEDARRAEESVAVAIAETAPCSVFMIR